MVFDVVLSIRGLWTALSLTHNQGPFCLRRACQGHIAPVNKAPWISRVPKPLQGGSSLRSYYIVICLLHKLTNTCQAKKIHLNKINLKLILLSQTWIHCCWTCITSINWKELQTINGAHYQLKLQTLAPLEIFFIFLITNLFQEKHKYIHTLLHYSACGKLKVIPAVLQ